MMIIPVGKIRQQVKQSQLRNESIFNSDPFEKMAITGMGDMGDLDNMGSESTPPVDGNLSQAIGQSNNPRMNLSNLENNPKNNPKNKQNGNSNKAVTPFDPYTGEPNDTLVTDFGEVARSIETFVRQNFHGEYQVVALNKGKDGQYTLTFGPVNKGPVITKK